MASAFERYCRLGEALGALWHLMKDSGRKISATNNRVPTQGMWRGTSFDLWRWFMGLETAHKKFMQSIVEPFDTLQETLAKQYARSPTHSHIHNEAGALAANIHHFIESLGLENFKLKRQDLRDQIPELRLIGSFADTCKHTVLEDKSRELDLNVRAIFEYQKHKGFRFAGNQAILNFRNPDLAYSKPYNASFNDEIDLLDIAKISINRLASFIDIEYSKRQESMIFDTEIFTEHVILFHEKNSREVSVEACNIGIFEIDANGSRNFIDLPKIKFQFLQKTES